MSRLFKICFIFLAIILVFKQDVNATDCTEQQRGRNHICPMYVVRGCICYLSGICSNGAGNSCQLCQDSDVISFSMGECPTLGANNAYVCTPESRNNQMCPEYVIQGCACYTSGECSDLSSNSCFACHSPDIVSFAIGKC